MTQHFAFQLLIGGVGDIAFLYLMQRYIFGPMQDRRQRRYEDRRDLIARRLG